MIIVGSARSDENKNLTNGKVGDQRQKASANDMSGEVSMQTMYTHKKGWWILRPKSVDHAFAMANNMKKACNNPNIGYDQNNRFGVVNKGIDTDEKTEADCSSLVREVVKESTGIDPGNFVTSNEAEVLEATGLFEKRVAYISQDKTPVFDGDVLVTKTKGHTVIVVSGNPRTEDAKTDETKGDLYFMRDLAKGMKGYGEIATLQRLLKDMGFYNGSIDRSFGAKTEKAVKEFQEKKGIKVSYPGTVGQKTWRVLLCEC